MDTVDQIRLGERYADKLFADKERQTRMERQLGLRNMNYTSQNMNSHLVSGKFSQLDLREGASQTKQ